MANFNIAFDNENTELGDYFEKSKNDIVAFIALNAGNHIITEIPSRKCNPAFIDNFIPTINKNNFIFIAYSHGNSEALVVGGCDYIHSNHNANVFVNSFFYSMACSSGLKLGSELINNGCLAFIGYIEDTYALLGEFVEISIDCDNYGIKKFITGSNIKDSFIQMKDYITTQIDLLYEDGETFYASLLRNNRDALVLQGNHELLFSSFNS